MKKLCTAALCALTLMASPLNADTRLSPETADLLQTGLSVTADRFIQPSYQAYADSAAQLTEATQSYCAGAADLATAHASFADTFLAWQRASAIGIGPLADGKGPFRVQMWPDPKGFSRRAAQRAVQSADPALLDPAALATQSVALVNLTTLETLLYGDLTPGSYACDLAHAIATYQAGLGAELAEDWRASEFRTAFDTARSGNATYPILDDLIREVLASLVVYSERTQRFKITRGLGEAPGSARIERTEARRSGLGLASIAASFQSLHDIYLVPDGFFEAVAAAGGSVEHLILADTAASLLTALAHAPDDLAQIIADDGDMAAELRRYGVLVGFHGSYLKQGLPASLGLSAGFTAADGD